MAIYWQRKPFLAIFAFPSHVYATISLKVTIKFSQKCNSWAAWYIVRNNGLFGEGGGDWQSIGRRNNFDNTFIFQIHCAVFDEMST